MVSGSCKGIKIPIFPQGLLFKYRKQERVKLYGYLEVINWGLLFKDGVVGSVMGFVSIASLKLLK